jgi:hypothetical protein
VRESVIESNGTVKRIEGGEKGELGRSNSKEREQRGSRKG